MLLYLIYMIMPVLVVYGLGGEGVQLGEEGGSGQIQLLAVDVEVLGNSQLYPVLQFKKKVFCG